MKRYRLLISCSLFGLACLFVVAYAQSRVGQGVYRGQFNGVVADDFDTQTSQSTYTLKLANGKEIEVVFADADSMPFPGSHVAINGQMVGGKLRAGGFSQNSAFAQPPNSPIGEQRFVIALIRFQNDPAGNENVTVQQVLDKMVNPTYSVSDWFDEASYGKTWATADVFGWFTLPMDRACNPSGWRSLVIPLLDAQTNLLQYNRLYIMVPGAGGCSWGGLGTLGPSNYTTNDGTWSVTTSWTRSEYFNESLTNPRGAVFVTAHEVGHNFGQNHGNGLTWNNNRALGPFDCDACESTNTEYADAHSALGGGWRPGHHNADHKRNLNWFNSGNTLNVTHTGQYDISPYETNTNQPIVLSILRGWAPSFNRFEYLMAEWRQPIGYDSELDNFGGAAYNGVFVHWDFRTNTYSFNLDMTPGDSEMRNAPLPVGQTWSDLYTKVSMQPLGVVGGKMRVEVTIGQPLATGFSIQHGFLVSGGQAELAASDDLRARINGDPTLNRAEPPIRIELAATAPSPSPAALRFELEARTSSVVRQKVLLFNFSSGLWDQVSDRDSTLGDSFVEADVWTNPARYIQGGSGLMRARVEWYVDRPLTSQPFFAELDEAVWKVMR